MRGSSPFGLAALMFACGVCSVGAGCDSEGCLRGEEGCTVSSACQQLPDAVCADHVVRIARLSDINRGPGGLDAVGATGDWLLENDRVQFVIDALEHPQHLAPSGGAILDASTRGGDDDGTNHIFQAVGALPTDGVLYTRSRVIEGDGYAAIQFDGHLVASEEQRVYTRYELRACEPGLRVRTEMINGSDDNVVWSNADGTFWGGRSMMAFTPTLGEGYFHPGFGLSTLNDAFRRFPYLVGASHSTPASAIATVPCNLPELEGFESGQVGAVGTPRRIVPPRDYEVFERFFALGKGQGAAPGVDVALALREQLFGEGSVAVSGRIAVEDGADAALGEHTRAALLVSEGMRGEPAGMRTPITEAVPAGNGAFRFRVPANRHYTLEIVAFGAPVRLENLAVGNKDISLGTLRIPAAGRVEATVRIDGDLDHAQLFVLPDDDDTQGRVTTRYFGTGPECGPLLGAPFGGSPACNRVLVNGAVSFDVPPGRYQVWASAGLGASVAKQTVEVLSGEVASVELSLRRHNLPGLSADFHVHGAKSFDSTIPDLDRVRAFLASGIDVIAATDHDAVWDYADAMRVLHADQRIRLMTGVETTGQILFSFNSSVYFPQVVGHWILWPLPFDDEAPRNGAPWDELVEPGALFERVAARGFDRSTGVIQLNHPWANLEFGRDLGFPRALGIRLDQPLPLSFDGTGPSLFLRTPPGASFGNGEYDAQEVMNGTNNELLLAHRALWFYFLNQGIVRAGTANSDSHSLTDNVLGTPRNIVFSSQTVADFDVDAFNAEVKAGHMMGTNGPLIRAFVLDNGARMFPGTESFTPSDDAQLFLTVDAPAWVPVREVRIVVNGTPLVIPTGELVQPDDPLAIGLVRRLDTTIPLSTLLPDAPRDAWIVVEAGDPLPTTGDLDCDGVPDTTDNNGDGEVDWRDVDRDGDGEVTAADREGIDGRQACHDEYGKDASIDRPDTGPLKNPPAPARDDDGWSFVAVTPDSFPFAFTNPLLIDRTADGFTGPGVSP